MKKINKIFLFGIMLFVIFELTGCGSSNNKHEDNNTGVGSQELVLYFSATGNTKNVAEAIANAVGADLVEIEPKDEYTAEDLNYNDDKSRATKEQRNKDARPGISNTINVDAYDTIYIGYPIWWGTNPRIILTLLDKYNFDDKDVILFCTSGSSGIETSVSELKKYNSRMNIVGSKRFNRNVSDEEVKNWINTLK